MGGRNMTSKQYRGYIRATKGTILGGVRANASIAFRKRAEAIGWLAVALDTNRGAGRVVTGEIHTLYQGKVVAVVKESGEHAWSFEP